MLSLSLLKGKGPWWDLIGVTRPKEQHKDADLGNLALMIAMNHPHPCSSGLD